MTNINETRASLRARLAELRAAGVNLTMELSFPALKEAEAKWDAKRKALADIYAEAGPELDLSKVKGFSSKDDALARIRELTAEIDEAGRDVADKKAIAIGAQTAAEYAETSRSEKGAPVASRKSFGEQFAASDARTRKGIEVPLDVEIKTLMSRSAGWSPESLREPGFVPYASAPLMVTDLIPTLPTRQAAIKYMEQTTRTNNAAERAEGGTYGEAAFALTERSVTVETIGVWLPVTDEQLEDEAEAAAMIDLELPFMLRQRLDSQILVGDGSTPNILGVNNKSSIQTQAKGSDPVFDAAYKAMTKVRVTGRAMPDAFVFHPNDWQGIRLTQTTDGIYILGNPADMGPARLWGLPVIQSDNQTENTGLVGDFSNFARLYIRRDVVVERTNAHDTYFINGKQAIRAGIRCATVWKRAAAFATITGI